MRMRYVVVASVVIFIFMAGWIAGSGPDYGPELSMLRRDIETLHASLCAEIQMADAKRNLLQIEVQALHGTLPSPPQGGINLLEGLDEPLEPEELSEADRRMLEVLARMNRLPRLPC